MTVLMTARFDIDAHRLETVAHENVDTLRRVAHRAQEHGLISHRFCGNDDGVLVVDLWPDEASFQSFYDASPEIGELMAKAGATSEPQVTFYRTLDIDDVVVEHATAGAQS